MNQPDATRLWCIHLKGTDDIIPMPGKSVADRKATRFNKEWANIIASPTPAHVASVIEWPHSADAHAEELAELQENDNDGWLDETDPETS